MYFWPLKNSPSLAVRSRTRRQQSSSIFSSLYQINQASRQVLPLDLLLYSYIIYIYIYVYIYIAVGVTVSLANSRFYLFQFDHVLLIERQCLCDLGSIAKKGFDSFIEKSKKTDLYIHMYTCIQ